MKFVDETPEVRRHWRDVMRDQGRKLTWLARQTGKAESTIDAYAYGKLDAPAEWLERVSELLGVPVTDKRGEA